MRIGVIGTGEIASAAVRGIVADGHEIVVSERSSANAQALAEEFDNIRVADNQGVVEDSDVIFLGLMAEVAGEVLGALEFREGQRVVTFMAGATLEAADAMVRPARAVAIMMPFPNIARGGSAIMMMGDGDLVREVFGARNQVFELNGPREMAAYLCAQALVSPVTRMISDAADWLGQRVEDRAQGEAFLRTLIASNLMESECGPLIEALNTPGGYNQRLRLHMEESGMGEVLKAGLNELE